MRFKGSGTLIRQTMGAKKKLLQQEITHFHDIADMAGDDYFVCGIVTKPVRGGVGRVDADLCVSGKKKWRPEVGDTVDFTKGGGALVVVPSF